MPPKKLTAKKCKLPFMRTLSRLTPEELKDLFSRLSPASIDDLGEIIFNSLYSDFGLEEKQVKKIKKALLSSEKDLRYIADSANPNQLRRKRLIRQGGQGLPILLTTLLPAIASLISSKL